MAVLEQSMKDVAKRITITVDVKFTRVREYKIRLWIAQQLIRLAGWISWCKVDIKQG